MTDKLAYAEKDILSELKRLKDMFEKGQQIQDAIKTLVLITGQQRQKGFLQENEIGQIRKFYGNDFLNQTLQGMALLKKFGYAGDFLMIDKIYTGNDSHEDSFCKAWDDYFLDQAAPKAVRNRKKYFKTLLLNKFEEEESISLLNIASGPARDLFELFIEKAKDKILSATCVEIDANAIEYAKNITEQYNDSINYVRRNIFRYNDTNTYDVIWSAGLFDYLSDKEFVYLLKKMKSWMAENGEIVIGNFNKNHNPSKDYMEIFGDWYLNHRTQKELINLAKSAGFKTDKISVHAEQENVNLFLHMVN